MSTGTHKPSKRIQSTSYGMHVNIRTFCRIIFTSLTLCAIGLLLDIDHAYATLKGWPNTRWLHHTLASNPSLLILLSLLWGLIITAFTFGWGHLESKALYIVSQEIKLELGLTHQMEDEIELELLLDQQIGDQEPESERIA